VVVRVRRRPRGYDPPVFGLRDERTPAAKRNQRIVLPLMLALVVVAVLGLALESEVVFGVAAFGVLTCGLAWRWA